MELTAVLNILSPVTKINSISDTGLSVGVELRTSTALIQPAMTHISNTVSKWTTVRGTDWYLAVAECEGIS